jgi:hypothetical protein
MFRDPRRYGVERWLAELADDLMSEGKERGEAKRIALSLLETRWPEAIPATRRSQTPPPQMSRPPETEG